MLQGCFRLEPERIETQSLGRTLGIAALLLHPAKASVVLLWDPVVAESFDVLVYHLASAVFNLECMWLVLPVITAERASGHVGLLCM